MQRPLHALAAAHRLHVQPRRPARRRAPTFGRQVDGLHARQVGHGAVSPRGPHPELLAVLNRAAGATAAGRPRGGQRGRLDDRVPEQLTQDLRVGRLHKEAVLLENQLDLTGDVQAGRQSVVGSGDQRAARADARAGRRDLGPQAAAAASRSPRCRCGRCAWDAPRRCCRHTEPRVAQRQCWGRRWRLDLPCRSFACSRAQSA